MRRLVVQPWRTLIQDINQLHGFPLMVAVVAGMLGISWPMGGFLLYGISHLTRQKVYGKLALLGAGVAMFSKIASLLLLG